MKWIVTLALSFCTVFNASAYTDGKTRIGSLPLKNGTMMLVQEYLSKASLPEKVVVVSNFQEVSAFSAGIVTKVLSIDDKISVFIKKGSHYFVYNNLRAVAIDEGDRLEKGDLIGEVYHDNNYDGYQMEMQVWYNYGAKTCRLPNKQVMGILQGDAPTPPRIERPKIAKHHTTAKHSKYAKHGKVTKGKSAKSKNYASAKNARSKGKLTKGKVTKSKLVSKTSKSKLTKGKTTKSKTSHAKKAPAKKKKK
jgi:hypothetical protein